MNNEFSKDSAELLLREAIIFGSNAMIERQEAMGQQSLINSIVLPINKAEDWKTLKRWGVQQLDKVDSLFCNAVLPEGWQKVATDHSMWSNLLDDRGLIRASIFYKAAFYDRDAFINASGNRFYASRNYDDKDMIAFKVTDRGTNKVVKQFAGGCYAVMNEVVGFLFDGLFYSQTKGEYSAQFVGFPVDGTTSSPITQDQFYEQYHKRNVTRHDLITAAEHLAQTEANEFIAGLPTDDSQWLAAFDYPEVA